MKAIRTTTLKHIGGEPIGLRFWTLLVAAHAACVALVWLLLHS